MFATLKMAFSSSSDFCITGGRKVYLLDKLYKNTLLYFSAGRGYARTQIDTLCFTDRYLCP